MLAGEPTQRPVLDHPDRPGRAARQLGDLLGAEPAEHAQEDHLRLRSREALDPRDGRGDVLAELRVDRRPVELEGAWRPQHDATAATTGAGGRAHADAPW